MAAAPTPHVNTSSLDSSLLDIPLKDAPVVSLRALEDGSDDFDTRGSKKLAFWPRLATMTLRLRSRIANRPVELLGSPVSNGGFDGCFEKNIDPSEPKKQWKKIMIKACIYLPILVLCVFGIVHLVNVFTSLVPIFWDDDAHSFMPYWGQPGQKGEGLASYPTDFTRDVLPKPCHSHNDYWRRIPLYDALHFGCTGVEADVWLFDNDLFVGHSTSALTRNRTFRSLYVNPLVDILNHQNPTPVFGVANGSVRGVFEEDPSQTLVLLVDFKTSGPELLPVVMEQLSALREKKYLSYYDGQVVHSGPITVVATGNAPFDLLTANSTYRDIFFDAPLADLFVEPSGNFQGAGPYHEASPFSQTVGPREAAQSHALRGVSGQGTVGTTDESTFDPTNSYYASVSFTKSIGRVWRGHLSKHQRHLIRGQIQGAHKKGLKVRYWNTPQWPIGLRNHIWDVLVREGVDYLNGDDLRAMTRMDWRRRNHHGWFQS